VARQPWSASRLEDCGFEQTPRPRAASEIFFEQTLFGRWLLNSLIIGVCVVAITLATAIPAGYAPTRLAGRNGEAL
jgi:ABC-type glycerol-3-phosphate transport system permease component